MRVFITGATKFIGSAVVPDPKLDADRRQDASGVGNAQQHIHVGHMAGIGTMKGNGCARDDPPRIMSFCHQVPIAFNDPDSRAGRQGVPQSIPI